MIRNISTPTHHLFLTDEFSQWYPSEFRDSQNRLFHCCEQWMMVKKAEFFNDHATAAKIMAAAGPSECKDLGREVKPFNPAAWDAAAPGIVLEGNLMKFSQNPDLWAALDATENRIMVEAAGYDKIWGIGLGAEAALAIGPELWPLHGSNKLGAAVQATRETLRASPELIAPPGPWESRRVLAFEDPRGQRTLRFTPVEVAAAIGASASDLLDALARMGEAPVQMDKPGFLKDKQLLSLSASNLARQVALSQGVSSAPARAPKP